MNRLLRLAANLLAVAIVIYTAYVMWKVGTA